MTASKAFNPFGPDAQVQAIEQMTVESDPARDEVYGRLDNTRDRDGLQNARDRSAVLGAVVAKLEAEPALPDQASAAPKTHPMSNPFA